VLVPKTGPERPKSPSLGTQRWKHRAIYNVKMRLTIQAEAASKRVKWKWYQFYSVRGYGAPSAGEFVCPYSGMIAKTIKQEEAVSVRRYWANCASTTRELIEWLELLPVHEYTRELNHYLLRMIVIPAGQRQIEEYTKAHPLNEVKPWRELSSITSNILRLDGHFSRQPRPTTELLFAEKRSAPIAL
jgi:hypothetical protein